MVLPTNRVSGGVIASADVNAIATDVNANTAAVTTLSDTSSTLITHSGNGVLTLDFATTKVGFVVAASAHITDIVITNGPAAGKQLRRTLFVDASAQITIGFASLNVVDLEVPVAMSPGDTFAADLLVKT